MSVVRCRAAAVAAALVAGFTASVAGAQELSDRITWHASLNAGYGRSSDLPTMGIPLKGTTDYRVFTLQTRVKLAEKDQLVVQFFNRRFGASPLAGAINDVVAQWAYWDHRFSVGDAAGTVRIGRTPLPRGLLNEVRYIGSVLPFFRPSMEVYGDAFDALDGTVVSLRQPIGKFTLEGHSFFGGTEWRSIVTTTAGLEPRIQRMENLYGSQLYLDVPFANIRLGGYAARMEVRTSTTKGMMTNTFLSAQSQFSRFTLRAEQSNLNGYTPARDNHHLYVQAVGQVTSRLQLAAERTRSRSRLFFTNPALAAVLPSVTSVGGAAIVQVSPNTQLKFEHHWRAGYVYDSNVATVTSQVPPNVVLAPERSTRYWIASIAASF
jgi:hypothetical protein